MIDRVVYAHLLRRADYHGVVPHVEDDKVLSMVSRIDKDKAREFSSLINSKGLSAVLAMARRWLSAQMGEADASSLLVRG